MSAPGADYKVQTTARSSPSSASAGSAAKRENTPTRSAEKPPVSSAPPTTKKESAPGTTKRHGCCRYFCTFLVVILIALRFVFRLPAFDSPPDVAVRFEEGTWDSALKKNLKEHGYAHVQGVLKLSEAQSLRNLTENFCYGEVRKALPLSWGGYTVPAFLDLPEFESARWILKDERLHKVLKAMFKGAKYKFANHNDIGCDFVGVWHKDILRGPVAKYQVHDVWGQDKKGERHDIYKILFYLQDHTGDSRSVKVVPGSHSTRNMSLDKGFAALHPVLGDAVIIDQRISHAGNSFYNPFGKGRIFLQVGFGKDNIFTDEFARGTMERQRTYQAKMLKSSQKKGLETVLTDIKFTIIGAIFSLLPPQLLNAFADIDVKKYKMLGSLIFGRNAEAEEKTKTEL
eukprot:TRINITY_DN921_c3_g1_i1.p1 TRINITY_DN921_c3_g1~~TRINITY_DN921_c3_g1_i1.p1  ORF type:complete len:425 (-),score=90.67 TRINITY_DN921_c3_g1_i1:68-1267(-)